MGKKYIIELEDKPFHKDGDFLCRVKGFNSLVFDMTGIGMLTPYTEPDLEQVRKEGYEKGLSDAWDAVRKIYNFDLEEREELFHDSERLNVGSICEAYSASEAIEKIRQYEQEKEEIQVGDEVVPRETEYDDMIVTRLWKDDYDSDCIDAIGFDGRISSFLVSRVSKTGKHYEIATVLKKMRGEQDGKRREE